MSVITRHPVAWAADITDHAHAVPRDIGIDTMRGLAILMVIGIHSLQPPLAASWQIMADAVLRPCVPIFLFASGYLTAQSRRVPLAKRLKSAAIPYTIAFVPAYLYMALHNPAMDHRPTTALARYGLAYVFVYYYVFVYVGCTIGLWLIFRRAGDATADITSRLAIALLLSIGFGLIVGSYLDPALARLGKSESFIEEVRMRDLAFWFSFAALGALVALTGAVRVLRDWRGSLAAGALLAYAIYAAVRAFGIGDAADYDSTAFFGYAAMLCLLLLAFEVRLPWLATLGSGSYLIYLWHIFIVMLLRDHTELRELGAFLASVVTYAITATVSIVVLLAVRRLASPRIARWLGA